MSANDAICSLPPDQLEDRLAMIRREILPHVRRRETLAQGVAWEFDRNPELTAKLERWLELERQCCGGLRWELRELRDADTLRLEVEGVDASSGFFDGLRGPAKSAAPEGGWLRRLAAAGGLGFGVAFFLFCVVPIGVAVVAGAAVAAPLAKLDDPWAVGAGTLALALPAWLVLKRRAGRAEQGGCGGDC